MERYCAFRAEVHGRRSHNMNKVIERIQALIGQRRNQLSQDVRAHAQALLSDIIRRGLSPNTGTLIAMRDALVRFLNEYASFTTETTIRAISTCSAEEISAGIAEIQDFIRNEIRDVAAMCDAEIRRCRPNIRNGAETPAGTVHSKIQPLIDQYAAEIDLAKEQTMKEYKQTVITYNVSGNNCRININSTDHSINVQNAHFVFDEVAKVIDGGINDSEFRSLLHGKLAAMREAVGTEKYKMTYRDFIATAANHATLLAHLIPALTMLLQ